MNFNVFICTKPFQWINVENIKKEDGNNILIIVSNFPNANEIARRIEEVFTHWKSIHVVENRLKAFLVAQKYNIKNLYVDSDYGRKSYVYSLTKGQLFVYDEGIGTYSIDTSEMPGIVNRFKKKIFGLLGAGTFQGGNWKTEGIFLYNKNYYVKRFGHKLGKKEVLDFEYSFQEFIEMNLEKLEYVFDFQNANKLFNKKIILYLTFHTVRPDVLSFIEQQKADYDIVIIKPHPHYLKFGNIEELRNLGYSVIENSVIAELLIVKLSKDNHVTLLHESCSACLNLHDSSQLIIKDFKNPLFSKEFDEYVINN